MSRRKRRPPSDALPGPPADSAAPAAPVAPQPSRRRVWLIRSALALGGPLTFLLLIELVLRLVGFGQPAAFLLSETVNDRAAWVANPRFGLRYFGPIYERRPAPLLFDRQKPAKTVRVFVFGESAAYGDPNIDFGLPRVLQTLLSARYPATHFEVINAAMAGINSHVVRTIADDCAAADGDLWVVYMGNNEVVGPFGAGTVFGPQAPGKALIRSSLAIKSTRFGQLLAAAEQALNPPPASKRQWQGMLMFVDNQVREGDPRMTRVYDHFAANLDHILDVADDAGVGVVVSTVASNLRDCAPFASVHRPGLTAEKLDQWQTAYQSALAAQQAADHAAAIKQFHAAADIDDRFAELPFALARSLLAIGDREQAARRFAEARDLDVLRFRCDSRLNELVRQAVAERPEAQLRLCDAEQIFADAAGGAPGSESFYEHVHLTFAGNYLLARSIAEQLEPLLPAGVRDEAAGARPWSTADQCARLLGLNAWAQTLALEDIQSRLAFAPFIHQSNHAEQLAALNRQANERRPRVKEDAERADELFAAALQAEPDDPALYAQLCNLHTVAGQQQAAIADARRAVELLPTSGENWLLLGGALAANKQYANAVEPYERAAQIDDANAFPHVCLGRIHRQLDQADDALAAYRKALAIDPRYGTAYFELGQLLEADGRPTAAEENYRLALDNRIQRPADLIPLAELCKQRGWTREAAEIYQEAALLSPANPRLRLAAGTCLVSLNEYAQARDQFAMAVAIAPDFGEAHFLLGIELGREQKFDDAIAHFQQAVRLLPQLVEPRINLALTLLRAGQRDEGLGEFRRVLEQDPDNAIARKHLGAPAAP